VSHSAGDQVRTCRYCGMRYRRTNWMLLKALRGAKDADGRLLEDTHQAACWQRTVRGKQEWEEIDEEMQN